MPDRVIRDELLESERWLALKDNADRLAYLALLLKADALGNFDAGEFRLLRLWRDFGIDKVPLVAKTLTELVEHDLVRLYESDSRRYLHLPRYRQSLRFTKRIFPLSPWTTEEQKQRLVRTSQGEHGEDSGGAHGEHSRSEVNRSGVKKTPTRAARLVRCNPQDEPAGFIRFWETWPSHDRKRDRADCLRTWRTRDLERLADQIVAHVNAMKASDEWLKDAGQYIPAPLVHLRKARWETAPMAVRSRAAEFTY